MPSELSLTGGTTQIADTICHRECADCANLSLEAASSFRFTANFMIFRG